MSELEKLKEENIALASERDELKYRMQVMADMVGEENWSLRNQLADAQARVSAQQDLITAYTHSEAVDQITISDLVKQHATLRERVRLMEKALEESLKIMPLVIERSWAEASIE